MRTLFALFVSFTLIGIMGVSYTHSGQPANQPRYTSLWMLDREAYAFWEKKLDDYASDWLKMFRTELFEEVRTINHLRIHQSSAWAHPDQYEKKSESSDSLKINSKVIVQP